MAGIEQLENPSQFISFDVPELGAEPESRQWFTVVLGAGVFATRAYSKDYALLKTEVYAEQLRQKHKIESNGGFPLVMTMVPSDEAYRTKAWFDGKVEVALNSLQEHRDDVPTPLKSQTYMPHNSDQGRFF